MFRYAHHFGLNVEYDEIHECLDMNLEEKKTVDAKNVIHHLDEIITLGTKDVKEC